MLLKIGHVECDVKIGAVMSTPRLGFTDNFFCVAGALTPHGISPIKVSGAFWGQCLTRAMETTIDQNDWILTIDYDSVFNARTLEALDGHIRDMVVWVRQCLIGLHGLFSRFKQWAPS